MTMNRKRLAAATLQQCQMIPADTGLNDEIPALHLVTPMTVSYGPGVTGVSYHNDNITRGMIGALETLGIDAGERYRAGIRESHASLNVISLNPAEVETLMQAFSEARITHPVLSAIGGKAQPPPSGWQRTFDTQKR